MDISVAEGMQLGCLIAARQWYQSSEPCKVEIYRVTTEHLPDGAERMIVEKVEVDGLKDITEPSLTGKWDNQDSKKICSVGLDVETDRVVDPSTGVEEPQLVSHQLYLAHDSRCLCPLISRYMNVGGWLQTMFTRVDDGLSSNV